MKNIRLLSLCTALACANLAPAASATEPAPAAMAEQIEMQHAMDALQRLLSAYTSGNQMAVESLLEPRMIGYSRVVDSLHEAEMTQKQLQLTLTDTRTQISEHVVLIQTRWNKRYVTQPGRQAVRKSGACTFVMRADLSGWRLSALNGDNPFSTD